MSEGTLGANIVELVDVEALRREVQEKYREVPKILRLWFYEDRYRVADHPMRRVPPGR